MRNGNKRVKDLTLLDDKRSYRTYEEWKPRGELSVTWYKKGSYRTYEEWKQVSTYGDRTIWNSVLTVPMRNGNRDDIL